jgi:hypothetical protein
VVGTIATIGAVFLFLARLAGFLMVRLPSQPDELLNAEFPAEFATSCFALFAPFLTAIAGRDLSHPGLLKYAAGVGALIKLSIFGLFLAIVVVVGAAVPRRIFRHASLLIEKA